ncbi:MAG: DUF4251 domain-containing protein [Bacteroidota bacterium]|nr:DUF4251 domain-containing protein [Bacteroidota bacterium]
MKIKYSCSMLRLSAFAIAFSLLFIQCSSSQKSGDQNAKLNTEDISNMVNNKTFIFVAQRANPMRIRSQVLTSEYDVTVKKDTLKSYLPFFGRAYQAPINPSEGGIQFTSTNFTYKVNTDKKGSWLVTIVPKDYQQIQQFLFRIFENGSASLNVNSTSKSPISFNGYIKKIKE